MCFWEVFGRGLGVEDRGSRLMVMGGILRVRVYLIVEGNMLVLEKGQLKINAIRHTGFSYLTRGRIPMVGGCVNQLN